MFHVLTETVAEEMTPTSRSLTLFDVTALQVVYSPVTYLDTSELLMTACFEGPCYKVE